MKNHLTTINLSTCNFLAVIFFSLVSTYAPSQNLINANSVEQIKIYGFVLDKNTKKPIPFAHIGLPKQGVGTTSGKNGYFELKIPNKYSSETMTVSFMGYKTYRKKVKDIQSPFDLYLEEATMELGEIIVADEAAILPRSKNR